jgi:hypothetical protein
LGLLDAQTYEVRKTAHGGNAGCEWRTTLYSPDGTFPELVSPLTASPSLADYELSISSVTTTAKEEFALHYGGESKSTPIPVGASGVEMELLLQNLQGVATFRFACQLKPESDLTCTREMLRSSRMNFPLLVTRLYQ